MLDRPSLAYQYIFDLCAALWQESGGPVLVIPDHPIYVREIEHRMIAPDRQALHEERKQGHLFGLVMSMEPSRIVGALPLVAPDGWIACVLQSRWGNSGFARTNHPDNFPDFHKTVRLLKKNGFTLHACYYFNNLRSIVWHILFYLCERLGKTRYADRCLFRMRQTYIRRGYCSDWASVRLILARKSRP